MGNKTLLSGLVSMRARDEQAIQRQRRLWLGLLISWVVFTALSPGIPGGIALWSAWQTGQWGDFWSDTFLMKVCLPAIPAISAATTIGISLYGIWQSRGWLGQARVLRQAAIEGHNAIAPLASEQPGTLAGSALPTGDASLGPLKRPPEEIISWIQMVACVLALPPAILGFILLAGWNELSTPLRLVMSIVATVTLVLCGAAFLWWWLMSTDRKVFADELGMQWKRMRWWGQTRARLEWQEARAFFTFAYDVKTSVGWRYKMLQIYALEGPQATFAWAIAPDASAFEQETSNTLCQLIDTRTRLPLRDLSAAAEKMEAQSPDSIMDWAIIKLQKRDLAALTAPATHSLDALKLQRKKRKWAALALMLIPLLMIGLVAGAAGGLALYQGHQYAQMLAQIRAHTPLYHDALTTPDGDWEFQNEPGSNPNGTFQFANGSYQLTGGYFMVALEPHTFGDVAIEVTVRLSGTADALKYDSVGLAFQTNRADTSDAMIFQVSTDGYWFVGHVYDDPFGPDSPHKTGAFTATPGTPNRLAVIIRSNQYICFVNDQLVGIYQNHQGHAGQVGVYHAGAYNELDQSASFNDFTVYSLT